MSSSWNGGNHQTVAPPTSPARREELRSHSWRYSTVPTRNTGMSMLPSHAPPWRSQEGWFEPENLNLETVRNVHVAVGCLPWCLAVCKEPKLSLPLIC